MLPAALALMMAVTWGVLLAPLDADGQQARTLPILGVLGIPPPGDAMYQALLQGLRELGYAEGQHLRVEYRWGEPQQFPAFASELVRLPAAVLVTFGTPAALAAKHATTTVPIVMALVGDPVRSGIVASLAQPGGNITGVTNQAPEMVPKRLELLKEVVPHASRVAFLWNPTNQDQVAHFQEAEAGARALGLTLHSVAVRTGAELEGALAAMLRERPEVLLMTGDSVLQEYIAQILAFAAAHRLPVVHQLRENVVAGGLLSYGTNRPHLIRHAAVYIDKILKGAKPADLPLEQPTKFELVLNLKTAQALGLTIPPSLLFQANEVIR
jgi:putative tryptophan/tyrosine transport system substrate-binding protein